MLSITTTDTKEGDRHALWQPRDKTRGHGKSIGLERHNCGKIVMGMTTVDVQRAYKPMYNANPSLAHTKCFSTRHQSNNQSAQQQTAGLRKRDLVTIGAEYSPNPNLHIEQAFSRTTAGGRKRGPQRGPQQKASNNMGRDLPQAEVRQEKRENNCMLPTRYDPTNAILGGNGKDP